MQVERSISSRCLMWQRQDLIFVCSKKKKKGEREEELNPSVVFSCVYCVCLVISKCETCTRDKSSGLIPHWATWLIFFMPCFFPAALFSRLSFALSAFSLSPSFSSCSHGAADKVTGRGKCFLAFKSALFYFSAHLFEQLTGQSQDNEFIREIYPPCPVLPPSPHHLVKVLIRWHTWLQL